MIKLHLIRAVLLRIPHSRYFASLPAFAGLRSLLLRTTHFVPLTFLLPLTFFSAKPTRQGTGLGLSLSYDIGKDHGGEMKVETKENKDSEFIFDLPFTINTIV
jgi:hypothetical protein